MIRVKVLNHEWNNDKYLYDGNLSIKTFCKYIFNSMNIFKSYSIRNLCNIQYFKNVLIFAINVYWLETLFSLTWGFTSVVNWTKLFISINILIIPTFEYAIC